MTSRRDEVLQALYDASQPLSIRDLADQLGVHVNTVRHHLDGLSADGMVESVAAATATPGRPPLMFRPVRSLDRGGERNFQLLARVLATTVASSPQGGARACEAGESWGRSLVEDPRPLGARAATNRLVGLMDDLGFAPDTPVRGTIGLRQCPFLELIDDHRDVVCRVHLGLMRGALDAFDAPLTVTRLDPLVEPDLCVAHLALDAAQ